MAGRKKTRPGCLVAFFIVFAVIVGSIISVASNSNTPDPSVSASSLPSPVAGTPSEASALPIQSEAPAPAPVDSEAPEPVQSQAGSGSDRPGELCAHHGAIGSYKGVTVTCSDKNGWRWER